MDIIIHLIWRRVFIASLMLLTVITTSALEVDIDGLTYDLSGVSAKVVRVTLGNQNSIIQIPPTVTYEGLSYTVNEIGAKCFVNIDWSYSSGSSHYCDLYENGRRVDVGGQYNYHVSSYCHIIDDAFIYDYLSEEKLAEANSYVKKVVLPNTIEMIGKYAFSNSQIVEVELAEGVKQINEGAFHTPNLADIDLHNSVETIGDRAFLNSKIKEIIIPVSVISLGLHTFNSCSLLRQIIYLGQTPPTNWTATTQTYVPNKNVYGNPSYSINNASIIEMISYSDSIYVYTGNSPKPTWTNNMEGYSVDFSLPSLNSEVGSYEVVIPATFTKGEESFTAHIPYRYTIEPVKLKAKVNSTSRTYGEANPNFTITYSGFVNGENESVLTSKPVMTTTANEKSAVGTYPIKISGGEAKNYTFEYEQGELTVNKASLGIQVMDANKVYGTENPTFTLGYSGLKNNETVPEWITAPKFTTTAKKESGAGTYEVSVTCEPKNYAITTNTPGKLTIKKAPLTVKANNVSMDYCGTMPTYSYTFTGFVNGDDESTLSTMPSIVTEATTTSNAGSYTITPDGAVANNYDMTYVAGTLTIKQRTLIVTAQSASRLYGEENPELTISYSGFVNDETKDVLDVEPTVSTTATIQSKAGTYDIRVNGGRAINYALNYQNGQLSITPRPLKAFVGNYERPYGENNPSFVIEYEGLVGNDTGYSLSQQPLARTSATRTSNVGTYVIEVTGGYSPNYTLTYGSGTLTIVKAEQTFTWSQDLTNLKVGDQVELQADASSKLPITFTMDTENYAEIYKAGSKTYMECKAPGSFHIKAVQDGNDNYYPTQRINKSVTIVNEGEYNPTLFIKQGENGMVSTKVGKGTTHTFTFLAETGWKIHSVTFNNTDVTSELNSDNTYTTPAINENSTLAVVYEQVGSAVGAIQKSNVRVLATADGIKVTGVIAEDIIRVYNIDGSLQRSVRAVGSQVVIPLHKDQVYIVKVSDKTVKLRL